MRMFFKQSFYTKISTAFLLLVLTLAITFIYIGVSSALTFVNKTGQKVNKNLASEMASHVQPFLSDSIQSDKIMEQVKYLNGINPEIDIYLLDSKGVISWFYHNQNPDTVLELTEVNIEPVLAFLNGDKLPIYGDDPLHAAVQKPFSVAPISILGNNDNYLYIILTSQHYDSITAIYQSNYILKDTLIGMVLILIATVALGLFVFRLLTNRLRLVSETVKSFEQGDLDKRIEVTTNDEIGKLGQSFNQMADSLVENMDEIKQIDKLRRELVANVSHDLRSPLASIQGYLETIIQKEPHLTEEERTKYYEIVLRNSKKLSKLVEELFELSKFDAKKIQPKMEKMLINDLVQDLALQFKPIAEKKDITLVCNHSGNSSGFVNADIALMERAITNLIDNSLKNTPVGGNVTIFSAHKKGSVVITIADTGIGIPEENLPRIFDRFYQVDPSRTVGSGAGLGLPIAKKILELHGSKLIVKSGRGKGTICSFKLATV